jgi:hypothetical protein
MNQNTDIHPLQHAAELRLLADVLELQHLTSQEASIRPIPMVRGEKAQRFIVIGTAAEVARLLEIAPAASVRSIGNQMANVMYNLAQQVGKPLGRRDCEVMDQLRRQWDDAMRIQRAGAQAAQAAVAHDHSEGGHHD